MRFTIIIAVLCWLCLTACPSNPPGTETTNESNAEHTADGHNSEATPTEKTGTPEIIAEPAAETIGADAADAAAESMLPESTQESTSEASAELPDGGTPGIPTLQAPAITVPIEKPDIVQIQPSLAVGSDGQLAMSYTAAEGDKKLGIFFVRIDQEGKAIGSYTRLDTFQGGNKTESSICALASGGYVVVWSMDTGIQDPKEGNLQIRFRLVDATGKPIGTESVQVKTDKAGNHWLARIACLANGGFAITGVYPDDATSFGSFVQRFDAQGKPDGVSILLNTETAGNQAYPVVDAAPDGTLVVAWEQGTDDKQAAFRIIPPGNGTPGDVVSPALTNTSARPSIALTPQTGEILLAVRQASGPFLLYRYDKAGKNPQKLDFPDTGATNFAQPVMLALGPNGPIAVLYLKGPNNNSASPTVAIIGPQGVQQTGFVITTGRIPLAYRPSIAYHKGTLWAAYTERTNVTNGLTIKLARFR